MRFYELYDNDKYPDVLWDGEITHFEGVKCPINDKHQHPGARIGDLHVRLKSSRTADLMWTVYSEFLISDKVARIFKKEKLTGYSLSPVTICGIKGQPKAVEDYPKYWELKLRGWGGMARPESGVKLLSHCQHCGLTSYLSFSDPSKLINESIWDGSDFFMVWPLPRFVFVTEKVRNIVKREKLTGCKFIPVEELPRRSTPDKPRTLSPGTLRLWMPEERARELGEPLGIY